MRISEKTKNTKAKKIIITTTLVVVMLAIASFAYWNFNSQNKAVSTPNVRPVNTVDYNPPTNEEKAETDQQKQSIIENQDPKPPIDQNLNITISRAGQLQGAGSPLSIRVLVDGASSGTCDFTLTKAGQIAVTKQSSISFEATTSSCGADIEASSFSQNGEWDLSVTAKHNNSTSEAATSKVTIAK